MRKMTWRGIQEIEEYGDRRANGSEGGRAFGRTKRGKEGMWRRGDPEKYGVKQENQEAVGGAGGGGDKEEGGEHEREGGREANDGKAGEGTGMGVEGGGRRGWIMRRKRKKG